MCQYLLRIEKLVHYEKIKCTGMTSDHTWLEHTSSFYVKKLMPCVSPYWNSIKHLFDVNDHYIHRYLIAP